MYTNLHSLQRYMPFVASNWALLAPFACTHFPHLALTLWEQKEQMKLIVLLLNYTQDTSLALLFKKLFKTTAKQSWSKASPTRWREEPWCQKSWMGGNYSSPNAVIKGTLHTKADRTIKSLLACSVYSFTSFINSQVLLILFSEINIWSYIVWTCQTWRGGDTHTHNFSNVYWRRKTAKHKSSFSLDFINKSVLLLNISLSSRSIIIQHPSH